MNVSGAHCVICLYLVLEYLGKFGLLLGLFRT